MIIEKRERIKEKQVKKGLAFLEERINKESKLPEIIHVFEKMCQMPMGDAEELQLLFETGSPDEDTYTILIVRQIEKPEDDEYFQITVDISYSFNDTENLLNKDWENFWNFDLEADFYEQIEKTQVFKILKDKTPIDIEVYIDET